jgi:hypothetical protein
MTQDDFNSRIIYEQFAADALGFPTCVTQKITLIELSINVQYTSACCKTTFFMGMTMHMLYRPHLSTKNIRYKDSLSRRCLLCTALPSVRADSATGASMVRCPQQLVAPPFCPLLLPAWQTPCPIWADHLSVTASIDSGSSAAVRRTESKDLHNRKECTMHVTPGSSA